MKQDSWISTTTQAEYGTTSTLGSPRGWLRRAYDSPSVEFSTFEAGSLTPSEISVGGVWYRPAQLPATGRHRELLRFFQLPPENLLHRPRLPAVRQAVIGLCAAVPAQEILAWLQVYRESGAAFTWWKTPEDRYSRSTHTQVRRRVDYQEVFARLALGHSHHQIQQQLSLTAQNMHYALRKWHDQTHE